jgi:hypothetical protein
MSADQINFLKDGSQFFVLAISTVFIITLFSIAVITIGLGLWWLIDKMIEVLIRRPIYNHKIIKASKKLGDNL